MTNKRKSNKTQNLPFCFPCFSVCCRVNPPFCFFSPSPSSRCHCRPLPAAQTSRQESPLPPPRLAGVQQCRRPLPVLLCFPCLLCSGQLSAAHCWRRSHLPAGRNSRRPPPLLPAGHRRCSGFRSPPSISPDSPAPPGAHRRLPFSPLGLLCFPLLCFALFRAGFCRQSSQTAAGHRPCRHHPPLTATAAITSSSPSGLITIVEV